MLLKEKGYDEFLAEQINRGNEDIKAGRVITLEEAKTRWQRTIEKKALEFAEIEENQHGAIYG